MCDIFLLHCNDFKKMPGNINLNTYRIIIFTYEYMHFSLKSNNDIQHEIKGKIWSQWIIHRCFVPRVVLSQNYDKRNHPHVFVCLYLRHKIPELNTSVDDAFDTYIYIYTYTYIYMYIYIYIYIYKASQYHIDIIRKWLLLSSFMFTIIIFFIFIPGITTDSMVLIFIVFHIAIKQFIFLF